MRILALFLTAIAAVTPTVVAAQMHAPPVEQIDPRPDGTRVDQDGVLGNFFPAAGPGRHPGILLLGGSEGGLSGGTARIARALQAAGFSVLQQSYYRLPGQPADFAHVPIETFDRGLAWLRRQPGVAPRRIAVVGGSKGAEGALIVASRHPELRGVVAAMPSAVVWPAFSWMGGPVTGSSWSVHGRDLPFLPYGPPSADEDPSAIYRGGLAAAARHPEAAIAIERSPAPILLVCGQADRLWPSCPMAEMLRQRDPRVTVLSYDDAGHAVFGVPLAEDNPALPSLAALGGSAAGNNAARHDGWPRVLAFLTRALAR